MTKVINTAKIAASLGPKVCKGVLRMHALIESDTVSTFAGKGMAQAWKILKNAS